jgi:hypothetical protein
MGHDVEQQRRQREGDDGAVEFARRGRPQPIEPPAEIAGEDQREDRRNDAEGGEHERAGSRGEARSLTAAIRQSNFASPAAIGGRRVFFVGGPDEMLQIDSPDAPEERRRGAAR